VDVFVCTEVDYAFVLFDFLVDHDRPTGEEKFMTVDDIITGGGYPIQIGDGLHVRTLLVFTVRKNNELCSAASSATASGRGRRRKRQVTFDATQTALTQQLLDSILSDQRYVKPVIFLTNKYSLLSTA
jgi:hypothetical protein